MHLSPHDVIQRGDSPVGIPTRKNVDFVGGIATGKKICPRNDNAV